MILQIALEAAATQQTESFRSCRKQHERAALAVGGAFRADDEGRHQCTPLTTFTLKKIREGTHAGRRQCRMTILPK